MLNSPTGLAPPPPQESQGQGSSTAEAGLAEAPFGMALEWQKSQTLPQRSDGKMVIVFSQGTRHITNEGEPDKGKPHGKSDNGTTTW